MIGKALNHYEIREPLGSGGMGDVYRAHDTSLNRDVAIKVLPENLADDLDRLARLKREAHLLAALNHPNVATIYGFEESGGTRFLVMELVKGESLDQRLAGGALPVDEALGICRQIAEALEAAHDEGIIHRDLKPANVLITPEGRAKVLDFGLAKTVERADADTDMSQSPTITIAGTETGVILGTAPYMSPEQVRGKRLDKRADIWAFGCVLYETLTGSRAFDRDTIADTLAAILEFDPDWNLLPKGTPAPVRALLHRCLQKNPKLRLRDIGDAWVEIETTLTGPVPAVSGVDVVAAQLPLWRRALPWTVAGIAVVALAASLGTWSLTTPTTPTGETRKSFILVEDGYRLWGGNGYERPFGLQRPSRTSIALSPDGKLLVYAATDGEESRLFLRALDEDQAIPIPGADRGSRPFFSPDGQSIGFSARDDDGWSLKRASITGGDLRTIVEGFGAGCGASWSDDGTIIFTDDSGHLVRVSENGGPLEHVTGAGGEPQVDLHCFPQVLPGGEAVLYGVEKPGGDWKTTEIVAQSLETGRREVVATGAAHPRYVPTGHLVYVKDGELMAVRFDPLGLEVTGNPVVVLDDVMQAQWSGVATLETRAGQYSFSDTGDLVYVPGGTYPEAESPLALVNRAGESEVIATQPLGPWLPRVSSDGRYLAYFGGFPDASVWIHEVEKNISTPLTSIRGFFPALAFSPDGSQIAFNAAPDGGPDNLYVMNTVGGEESRRLTTSDANQVAGSWSKKGVLAFWQGGDIWVLQMVGEDAGVVRRFIESPYRELYPTFSPSGEWLAYTSNETEWHKVWVRPYPGPGLAIPVTPDVEAYAAEPVWSRDGKELFYWERDIRTRLVGRLMVVDVVEGAVNEPLEFSAPRQLFEGEFAPSDPMRFYDVMTADQFVMRQPDKTPMQPATQINYIQNWFEDLKERLPTGR